MNKLDITSGLRLINMKKTFKKNKSVNSIKS